LLGWAESLIGLLMQWITFVLSHGVRLDQQYIWQRLTLPLKVRMCYGNFDVW
jgi:hypothetical protein